MKSYRILSMDGGGIKGILTARILERALKEVPGFLANVDMFAGTSSGGLLSLGLAYGKTPAELVESTILPIPVDMASYKSIPVLLKAADDADLSDLIPWLKKNFL